jgi:hypothetical protein
MAIDPIALAIDWLDTCKHQNWQAIARLYAPNSTVTLPHANELGQGDVIEGRVAIAAYWQTALAQPGSIVRELVEIYPGVDSAVLIYYDEHCHRVSEFLRFDQDGLIIAAARHAIPKRHQEAGLLGAQEANETPLRKAVLRCEARQTLYEARRLPVGSMRNDLRQRAVALRALAQKPARRSRIEALV